MVLLTHLHNLQCFKSNKSSGRHGAGWSVWGNLFGSNNYFFNSVDAPNGTNSTCCTFNSNSLAMHTHRKYPT